MERHIPLPHQPTAPGTPGLHRRAGVHHAAGHVLPSADACPHVLLRRWRTYLLPRLSQGNPLFLFRRREGSRLSETWKENVGGQMGGYHGLLKSICVRLLCLVRQVIPQMSGNDEEEKESRSSSLARS